MHTVVTCRYFATNLLEGHRVDGNSSDLWLIIKQWTCMEIVNISHFIYENRQGLHYFVGEITYVVPSNK